MVDLFNWNRFFENIPKILPYLSVTFLIVTYATIFGILLGMVIAFVKIKKIPLLNQIFQVYVSFMRGTPMLVQLMLIYYGLPMLIDSVLGTNINSEWDKVLFAYVTFILNQGAFLSAIFYSAATSVPVGQVEAGYSVGLTGFQTFRRILLPQAVQVALPAFGSDLVGLFQTTSLVFLIGVTDIMGRAKTIGSATKHVLEAYVFVAIVYIIVSLAVRIIFCFINDKLEYGRKRKSNVSKA